MNTRTIPFLFGESVRRFGNNPMMYQYGENGYVPLTYLEMQDLVHQFANGLLALGCTKGDRVVLISEGRNDWVMAELAIVSIGAINVPVSVKVDEPEDLVFRITHSGASFIVVSGRHSPKIISLAGRIPAVQKIIILDPVEAPAEKIVFRDEVMELGRQFALTNPGILQGLLSQVQNDDVANICYTSGTTADPKGIMLTHENYFTNVEQAGGLFDIPAYYTSVLILPWDHSFAHTAGIYALMKNGASMAAVNPGKSSVEAVKNIPVNIRENKPWFILSVPALAKNFRKNIEKGVEAKGKILKKAFDYGISLSAELHGNGFNLPKVRGRAFKTFQYNLINKVIYKKIRENFGGNLSFFVGGGALLDTDLQTFFYALGIPMFQGYGLTEASPIISSNTPTVHKLGSSGRIVENMELKIADADGNTLPVGDKGEIVVRGKNIMKGYWKNDAATSQALRNGWLWTGDMGYLDEDGFLYVLGRFKSLLIGSDGEKFSPEGIEEALIEKCSLIDQVMLINNQHPYTAALIVPNRQACRNLLLHSDLPKEDQLSFMLDAIRKQTDQFKEKGLYSGWFPQRWIPTALGILEEEFNEENHMMNSTMKMVRGKINEHFSERIEKLFTAEGKEINHQENLKAIRTLLGF